MRESDAGEFRCRVDFKKGRTVNTIISLKVIGKHSSPLCSPKHCASPHATNPQCIFHRQVLPTEVRITEQSAAQTALDSLIGPLDEGSQLRLTCLAFGGKPKPTVVWLRDYNVIDDSFAHTSDLSVSNELVIDSLNKNYLLSILTCQASNNNLTAPVTKSITIDLNLKPVDVSLRVVSKPLIAGQSATFECSSHGSKPQATLHWLFQGTRHDTPLSCKYRALRVGRQPSAARHRRSLSVRKQRQFCFPRKQRRDSTRCETTMPLCAPFKRR